VSLKERTPVPGGRRAQRARKQARIALAKNLALGGTGGLVAAVVAIAALPGGLIAQAVNNEPADAAPAIIQAVDSGVDPAEVTTETLEVDLAPGAVERNDPTLAKGETKVVTEGEPGVGVRTYTVITVGNGIVTKVELPMVVLEEPIDQVTAIGTKEPVAVPADMGPVDANSNRAVGQQLANDLYGWAGDEWVCLDNLWARESGWNHQVANKSSGAYGIPQALPGKKMS